MDYELFDKFNRNIAHSKSNRINTNESVDTKYKRKSQYNAIKGIFSEIKIRGTAIYKFYKV